MNGPQTGRQRSQLNTFDATLFDEGDWVLKVVVRILCAVECEDSAGQHGLAVNRFDYPEFVRADLDQRHFAHDPLERILDQVQAGFEDVRLNADFAFRSHDAAGRHLGAEITSLFDCDLARADVDEDAA